MSTILENRAVRDAVLPFTVEQYHALSACGLIPEKTELLRGVIIEKRTKSPYHTWTVHRLVQWFESRVRREAYVRKDEPLTLDVSEPEPDVAIVAGNVDDYATSHPRTAHLVVEVAIASEDLDREKAEDYARAQVTEYWLVLPQKRAVEVLRDPSTAGYANQTRYTSGDCILPAAFPHLSFPVNEILRPN